ncbi:hypothetical protein MA16_Dca025181 [Dendrobium catenatum]|uniref:Uncharacterized protein n=1 Tax=Dendrobium catenatum TaxID=906689 RepID=A0A2I0WZC7_9ASPA|nr:hypothetical protein MA16_Dca025181 [Dendrobium catenatum]
MELEKANASIVETEKGEIIMEHDQRNKGMEAYVNKSNVLNNGEEEMVEVEETSKRRSRSGDKGSVVIPASGDPGYLLVLQLCHLWKGRFNMIYFGFLDSIYAISYVSYTFFGRSSCRIFYNSRGTIYSICKFSCHYVDVVLLCLSFLLRLCRMMANQDNLANDPSIVENRDVVNHNEKEDDPSNSAFYDTILPLFESVTPLGRAVEDDSMIHVTDAPPSENYWVILCCDDGDVGDHVLVASLQGEIEIISPNIIGLVAGNEQLNVDDKEICDVNMGLVDINSNELDPSVISPVKTTDLVESVSSVGLGMNEQLVDVLVALLSSKALYAHLGNSCEKICQGDPVLCRHLESVNSGRVLCPYLESVNSRTVLFPHLESVNSRRVPAYTARVWANKERGNKKIFIFGVSLVAAALELWGFYWWCQVLDLWATALDDIVALVVDV